MVCHRRASCFWVAIVTFLHEAKERQRDWMPHRLHTHTCTYLCAIDSANADAAPCARWRNKYTELMNSSKCSRNWTYCDTWQFSKLHSGFRLTVLQINEEQNKHRSLPVFYTINLKATYLRVTVPNTDSDNSSKEIKVSSSFMIKQPLHMSLVQEQWLLVICFQWRCNILLTDLLHTFVRIGLSRIKQSGSIHAF